MRREEQAAGLRYVERSALFAPDTERLALLRHLIFDPMHMVLAGGVATTQLSGLLAACKAVGVEPSRLDAYAACWRAPSHLAATGGAVLPANWFVDRWVAKEDRRGLSCPQRCPEAGPQASMQRASFVTGPLARAAGPASGFRAFASEMLSAVPVIRCWLQDVAPALPALRPHADAWALLAKVVDLLFHDPDVATKTQVLQDSIDKWHAAFVPGTQCSARPSCVTALSPWWDRRAR